MKKITLFIFGLIFLVCFSSAIKISPSQQKLIINSPELNCGNIWILPEENYSISSKWSVDGRGDLAKYTLSKEDVGVDFNSSYLGDGNYEFCFSGKKNGEISGIIYFYLEREMVEIGSWIDLEVSGNSFSEKTSLISGNLIKEIGETKPENFILFGILGFLVVVLIFVLFIGKRNKRYLD